MSPPVARPSPDLTVAGHTLGSACTFGERVGAAAAAGFAGIGLRVENYRAARAAGRSDADLLAVLAAAGIAVTEIEFAAGWATPHPSPDTLEREETLRHMAEVFDVPRINAGLPVVGGPDDPAAGLAALCDRLHGLDVAVEFLPYGPVPTLAAAAALVARADRPNATLLLDLWHLLRSSDPHVDPAVLDRVVALQLGDIGSTPHPDPRHEALHHRLAPGHGSGGVARLVADLVAEGLRPQVVSVEVPSDALLAGGVDAAARTTAAAARRVLAGCDVGAVRNPRPCDVAEGRGARERR